MRISTFIYTFKQGLKNIFRNKMFSLASVGTMSACIFLFGVFYALVVNFQYIVKEVESGVSITVFFDEGTTEEQMLAIRDEIAKRMEVSEVNYISAETTWERVKQDYFKGDESVAESFADDNPLAESASLEIYLNDVSMQQALVTYIESMESIREVNHSEMVANTLSSFNVLIGYVSVAIITILIGVSIFLISNTVTIGIAVRKEEIAIMKLIGATDFFVRFPFIIEGVLIGLIGSALPLAALYYLYNSIQNYMTEEFHMISGFLKFISVYDIFRILIPVSLFIGVGIGFLGSFSTIRRHLKV